MSRVKKMAPKVGCIRILPITEKQHQDMVIVTGKRKEEEKEVREYQLSFF